MPKKEHPTSTPYRRTYVTPVLKWERGIAENRQSIVTSDTLDFLRTPSVTYTPVMREYFREVRLNREQQF